MDEPASNLHGTVMFEVNGTKQTAQIDSSEFDWETRTVTEDSPASEHTSESDSDEEPDLIGESETESDEDTEEEGDAEQIQTTDHKARAEPARAPQQNQTGVSAIPPMIARSSITQIAAAYAQFAVSTESGTAPWIIRNGEALATLRQITQSDIKHQQTVVIIETARRNTVASARHSEDKRGAAGRAETTATAEKERLKEKKSIWDFVPTQSGHQIITAVKAGEKIGSTGFPDWVNDVGDHLKFGPRTTPQLKECITCLLYAMRMVVAKNPEKPGVMKGFEGVIKLVDPNTTPVKCRHRRYSPKEKAIIRAETRELLDNGMIDVSDSPWSATVVLVKVSDGKWRFCVNYTATVNRFLRHDAQPLPK